MRFTLLPVKALNLPFEGQDARMLAEALASIQVEGVEANQIRSRVVTFLQEIDKGFRLPGQYLAKDKAIMAPGGLCLGILWDTEKIQSAERAVRALKEQLQVEE